MLRFCVRHQKFKERYTFSFFTYCRFFIFETEFQKNILNVSRVFVWLSGLGIRCVLKIENVFIQRSDSLEDFTLEMIDRSLIVRGTSPMQADSLTLVV